MFRKKATRRPPAKIEELGGRVFAVGCDVSRAEDVKAALDKAPEELSRLDFAFNNAGSNSRFSPRQISPRRSGIE